MKTLKVSSRISFLIVTLAFLALLHGNPSTHAEEGKRDTEVLE